MYCTYCNVHAHVMGNYAHIHIVHIHIIKGETVYNYNIIHIYYIYTCIYIYNICVIHVMIYLLIM